jgi:hypothetical protein
MARSTSDKVDYHCCLWLPSNLLPSALCCLSTTLAVFQHTITSCCVRWFLVAGVPGALLGHMISFEHKRPTFPPLTPPDFKSLAERCWDAEPSKRCKTCASVVVLILAYILSNIICIYYPCNLTFLLITNHHHQHQHHIIILVNSSRCHLSHVVPLKFVQHSRMFATNEVHTTMPIL